MPKKAATGKSSQVKAGRQRSSLEDRYNEIFRMVSPGFQPHPLPDNVSLEQPSPFTTVPSITTNTVLEDIAITETRQANPNA